MNRPTLLAAALALPLAGRAQALYNNGAALTLTAGTQVYVQGDYLSASGSSLANAGTLHVTGTLTNNAAMPMASGGTLTLDGSTAQTLGGTADYYATNVVVNNAAGITLATRLRVEGTLSFTSGIVAAPTAAAPVAFAASGTVAGPPTDASHVKGYVLKEGTGSFTYPLGDGTRYQPAAATLSANSAGLLATYLPTDAGTAPFTAGGTAGTPLVAYNRQEYWDLTPVGTATGSVTLFFDDYRNPGITSVADLRVAHRTGGAWLNEGAAASSGAPASGSVTSNALSSWSPFALGSASATSPLPVELLAFLAQRQGEAAHLSWATATEKNSAWFEVQVSADGITFQPLGRVAAAGSSLTRHDYAYLDAKLPGYGVPQVYYRLRQVDQDGTAAYSPVRVVAAAGAGLALLAAPNPLPTGTALRLTVQAPTAGPATLTATDMLGRVLLRQALALPAGPSALAPLDAAAWPAGVYALRLTQGGQQQVVRVVRE